MAEKRKRPTAVIITTEPIEYVSVRDHLLNVAEEIYGGTIYESGDFASWKVGIIEIGEGGTAAAFETERAIHYFQPEIVLFVGVADGLRNAAPGDVVCATKVYGYEYGKAATTFETTPEVGNSTFALIQRAKVEGRKHQWYERVSPKVRTPSPPKVLIAPIAAGEKEIISVHSATYQFLQSHFTDAIAVETEAHGFLQAIHANQSVDALVIRGITTLISHKDEPDSDSYRSIAAQNASAFAFEILAKHPQPQLGTPSSQVQTKMHHSLSAFTDHALEESALVKNVFGVHEMNLDGHQYRILTEALISAFPTLARLEEMVRFRLDKNIHAIALGGNLKEIVFKLIEAAEAEGWTRQLLIAARESNAGNPALLAFSQQFGLALATPPQPELERIIKTTHSFFDINQWRTRLGQIEAQICRIEIATNKGTIYGTGFLVGPNVVITNYHVMEVVIESSQAHSIHGEIKASPVDVLLRFDYKKLPDGTTVPGTVYRLDTKNWLIDQSPMSPVDKIPEPKQSIPQLDQLDYALICVDGSPGTDPIGSGAEPGAPPRQWITVPTQPYDFQSGAALFIIQHPKALPLQLAFDTDAIIGVNANCTRVTYKVNTCPGSSGAPCFNSNWELVALHHSGDPNFDTDHKPIYNEGIPLTAILNLLEHRGLEGILSTYS